MEIKPIAYFRSPFPSKFGIPKQSGIVEELRGEVVFEPSYRNPDMVRGLEKFDYIWLIWGFSANPHEAVSPLVRPPLLGGNTKVGVFASRSPFRPNALGLSSVRIDHIELSGSSGPVIHVKGADLMDGSPVFDIKPYVTFADSHASARSGFVDRNPVKRLRVVFPESLQSRYSQAELDLLRQILELDPRPHYQHDAQRIYGMPYAGGEVHFRVNEDVLYVVD